METQNQLKDSPEITISDLTSREVSFPRINFSLNIQSVSGGDIKDKIAENSLKISVNWEPLAKKRDQKGLIMGCDFKISEENFKAEIYIRTKMEFNKIIPEGQVFYTSFFQSLAATLFFPFLVELIASNFKRLDFSQSPLILDRKLLDMILEETEKQGPLSKINDKKV
jgi:hypothetical protein